MLQFHHCRVIMIAQLSDDIHNFKFRSAPQTSECTMINQLKDGTTYMKSLCLLEKNSNWNQAYDNCAARNMQLFTVNSLAAQKEVQRVSYSKFGTNPRSFLWVNGVNSLGWVSKPDGQSVYSGLDWERGTPSTSDCLAISNAVDISKFAFTGSGCNAIMWVYCEFIDATIPSRG